MTGHVEVYINCRLIYRWQFQLNAPESLPWEIQEEIRERQVKDIKTRLRENVMPVFKSYPVQFFITYQSKLNGTDNLNT